MIYPDVMHFIDKGGYSHGMAYYAYDHPFLQLYRMEKSCLFTSMAIED